jgi:hypothetical protein
MPYFRLPKQVVQMQQGGGLQHDGGTEDACRAHQEGEQTGGEAIRGAQVGRTLVLLCYKLLSPLRMMSCPGIV